jgi:apolipoprotein D and lipocalin family protein
MKLTALAAALSFSLAAACAQSVVPLEPVTSLDVARYLGTWYQVALYPNGFQSQCVSETTATYRERSDGAIEVRNRCRKATGEFDEAIGYAVPTGTLAEGTLRPAQLEVSFLPSWLRWAQAIGHWGWGAYWVIQLAPDYRYAVVSEGSRKYLWVLSRTPALTDADDAAIRALLQQQGYDLTQLQMHPQRKTPRSQ